MAEIPATLREHLRTVEIINHLWDIRSDVIWALRAMQDQNQEEFIEAFTRMQERVRAIKYELDTPAELKKQQPVRES